MKTQKHLWPFLLIEGCSIIISYHGIATAPAVFQRTIETILRGIPDVCVFIDDILVSGSSESDHLQTLERVLSCLEDSGVKMKLLRYETI